MLREFQALILCNVNVNKILKILRTDIMEKL